MASKETLILKVKADTKEATKGLEQVKKGTKETSNEALNSAGNFSIMGVSLNSVKTAFARIIPMSKAMFGSIKAGLISTGIGAFVVAIGSLMAYFTQTKRGSELLSRAMKGLGAGFSVIIDRVSALGEFLVGTFSDPQQAVKDLWQAIKTNLMNRVEGIIDGFGALGDVIRSAMSLDVEGIKQAGAEFGTAMVQMGTGMDEVQQRDFVGYLQDVGNEIVEETKRATELENTLQRVADAEREYSIQKAQTRQEIQKARLDALDESKSLEDRIDALNRASELEIETTEKTMEMAKMKLDAKREEISLGESMAEDLDEVAQLEVALIDLQTQSFQTRKRIATELETLNNERVAKEKADIKAIADAEKKLADQKKKDALNQKKLDKTVADSKKAVSMDALNTMAGIFGRESRAGKGLAIAQTTMNTHQAVTNALANTPAPPPFPMIAGAVALAKGLASIKSIISTPPPQAMAVGGMVRGGGSGTSDSISARLSRGESVINAKSTRMFRPLLSALNEAGGGRGFADGGMVGGASGGVTTGVVKAFVVADDMTNEQDRLTAIRRKATI